MAEEELQVVRLRTDFYKDGFSKILIAIALVATTIIGLGALSIYLVISKPAPIYFKTDNDFRILPPIPVDQPYISDATLYQWISQALPTAFTYDFLSYNSEQVEATKYFTSNGWQNLLGHISNFHLDFTSLQNARMFVNAQLTGAPFILNKGLLQGIYSWYVQIPMNLSYSNGRVRNLVVVAWVVRIPTTDNLSGIAIENLNITSQDNRTATNA